MPTVRSTRTALRLHRAFLNEALNAVLDPMPCWSDIGEGLVAAYLSRSLEASGLAAMAYLRACATSVEVQPTELPPLVVT